MGETRSLSATDARILNAVAALFGLFCLVALATTLPAGTMLSYISGIWMSLGIDLRDGVFYRPLISDAGFGGTRYFPLWFVIHAALIKAGLSPLAAGHAISLAAAVAWVAGAHRLMRDLAVPRGLAGALSILTLCTSAGFMGLTTVRGDLLPAALNLWGMVYGVRAHRTHGFAAFVFAVAFFGLAILAKITAVFGVVATAVVFAANDDRRRGVVLTMVTAVVAGVLIVVANAASDGRMLASMGATAALGVRPSSFVTVPLKLLTVIMRQDPMTVVIVALFVVGVAALPRRAWREIPTCLAFVALAATLVLFAAPGTAFNHLIDVLGLALVFVGYQIARGRISPSFGALALAAGAIMSVLVFSYDVWHRPHVVRVAAFEPTHAFLRQLDRRSAAPLFAETPLFPALDGERAFLLDPAMFEALNRGDSRFEQTLAARLAERHFRAVVMETDTQTEVGREFLTNRFGSAFMPTLTSNYDLVKRFPPYSVYLPKAAGDR